MLKKPRQFDAHIISAMHRYSIPALRGSLALVFVWFGLLKPLGLSPVDPMVMATVDVLPVFEPPQWLVIIGWWEVLIGLAFLHRTTIRLGLVLLALHMVGAFMPIAVAPQLVFQDEHGVYAPTLQGQYIIKNFILISAAIVIGGTLRQDAQAHYAQRV